MACILNESLSNRDLAKIKMESTVRPDNLIGPPRVWGIRRKATTGGSVQEALNWASDLAIATYTSQAEYAVASGKERERLLFYFAIILFIYNFSLYLMA